MPARANITPKSKAGTLSKMIEYNELANDTIHKDSDTYHKFMPSPILDHYILSDERDT
jgi:hypothetical protein